jgi:uncharacterized 2Fe-2S/4Fe-4S cluster protein (DUF4445 family)
LPNITFRFSNLQEITTHAHQGEKLLETARHAGVAIDAPCSGNGTCGKCRIRLVSGELESEQSRHITDEDYAEGWRLACSSIPLTDVVVEVPDTASAFKTGIRTADLNDPKVMGAFEETLENMKQTGIMESPCVKSVRVKMDEPTLDDTLPDIERLEAAVEDATGQGVTVALNALKKLAQVLRESAFDIRVVLLQKSDHVQVLDVLPGTDEASLGGLAIDIGTTTVTGVLVDIETGKLMARASAGNGQIRYGADVINRIIESVKPGGSERLRKAVVDETLVPLIDSLCRTAGMSKQRIYRVSIAGNTTMEHLLLGLYADPVRMEPFVPSFFVAPELSAADVIPNLNGAAKLTLAPNVGSYVGGDITAGVLTSTLWTKEEMTLFADLGTNGELVLGNSDYMLTCACSAGPAFEGGDISCGMRATTGAIQALDIDKETMAPTCDIIGDPGQKPIGLCGSGLIDTVSELFACGIINAKGKFVREGDRVKHDEYGMGRYVIAFEDESDDGREVSINEVDIDNFIRAKGAIFSAIRLMLEKVGLEPQDIDHIMVAGGIGGGLNFDRAIYIGMLPDVDREKYSYIGNSSLTGAYAALLSHDAQLKTQELGRNMTYVELSNEPTYMDEFVSACFIPHTNASFFPNTAQK